VTHRRLAGAYLAAVLVTAAGVALGAVVHDARGLGGDWRTFAAFAVLAAATQLFRVRTPANQCYHLTPAVLLPAVFVLPLGWLLLLPLAQHAPEQLRERYPPHIQLFNAANYTLDLAVASGVAAVLGATGAGRDGLPVQAAAGAAFVLANHLLLAVMLRLARGHSLRTSGLFGRDALATDLALAGIGIALLACWRVEPMLVAVGIVPLALVHRSLSGRSARPAPTIA
jgi:hypothetical protein